MPIQLTPVDGSTELCDTTGTQAPAQEEEVILPVTPGDVVLTEPADEDPCGQGSLGFYPGYFNSGDGSKSGSGGSGVTDHGALSGLADDDHSQYQLRDEKGETFGYAELDGGGSIPADQHGDQPGGTLHDLATDTIPGFLSPTDKQTLDDIVGLTIPVPIDKGGTSATTVITAQLALGLAPQIDDFPITVDNTTVFVLSFTPTVNSETVYLNGMRLRRGVGNDYTLSGATVTLLRTTLVDDLVSAEYTHS